MRFVLSVVSAMVATFYGVSASVAAPSAQSGLMSLGTSQTARMNVANLLPTGADPRPESCQVSLRFLDEAGAPFGARNGRTVASAAALQPGQSAALELPSALAPRGLFRTVVQQINASHAPNPCAGIVITIEVYDSPTGRTSVVEHLDARRITEGPVLQHVDEDGPADRRVQAGLSTPRFGLMGLARLQRARLHVVNLAPIDQRVELDACVVTMSFVDQVGAPIIGRDGGAIAREVSLAPGASSRLDLSFNVAVGPRSALRRMFRPILDAGTGVSRSSCSEVSATLEIADISTGRADVVSTAGGALDSAEPLDNGVAVAIDGSGGSMKFFRFDVPEGATDLQFRMTGGSGDADLYVRFGALPTTSSWDARPYTNGNNEIVSYAVPASGAWYLMVRGYQAYAGASLIASFSSPPPPPSPGSATDLANGVAVSGLSGGGGSQQHFRINVPAGRSNLTVQMSGGTGDADLYVRYASPPTLSTWDARPYLVGNSEVVARNTPDAGDWYVMVRGYTAYSGVTLKATYTPAAPDAGSPDFLIALSPVTPTLAAGTSIPIVVSTATLQGGSQTIALSVDGLPANVTATFAPATITSGQSATLTLTAAPNAVIGDKAFTVTGTSAFAMHQAIAVVSVMP